MCTYKNVSLHLNRATAVLAPPLQRALKGVMRVGSLAKGLLLHGHLNMEVTVTCDGKPTRQLLTQILDSLPTQIEVGWSYIILFFFTFSMMLM